MYKMKASISFENRKFLVTGASSGLGRTVSIDLAQKGATLVITGRSEEELKKTISLMDGVKHTFYPCKLDEEHDLTVFFNRIVSDGVKLSGIVHCAGLIPLTPVNTLKRDKIVQCMGINFYALIELIRCFSKSKFHTDKASIVEISSISSLYPGKCQTIYAASKAAANAAVQAMAIELAPKGIRVNSVLPGIIDTPATHLAIRSLGEEIHDKTLSNQLHGLIPMGEISDVVTFLLSDLSSAITGRTIFADGGYIDF